MNLIRLKRTFFLNTIPLNGTLFFTFTSLTKNSTLYVYYNSVYYKSYLLQILPNYIYYNLKITQYRFKNTRN